MGKSPEERDPATPESVNEQALPPNESSTAMAPGMNTDYAGDPTTPAAVNVQGDRIQSPTPDGPPAAAEETAAPEDEAEGPGTGAYEDRTMDQLRVVARGRGLPTSGTKDELIDRLRG